MKMAHSPDTQRTLNEKDRESIPEGIVTALLEKFNQNSVAFKVKSQSRARESRASKRTKEKNNASFVPGGPENKMKKHCGGRKRTTRHVESKVARKNSPDSAVETLQSTLGDYEMTNQRSTSLRDNKRLHRTDKDNDSGAGNSYVPERSTRISSVDKTRKAAKNNSKDLPSFGEPSCLVRNSPQPDLEYIRQKRQAWLKTRESDGTWIQCCYRECGKWRLAFEYEDAAIVPDEWFCNMNHDPEFASCDVPEEYIPPEVLEEQLETEYHVGSIVWARLDGYPWTPAIVDDCPDELRWCQLVGKSPIPTKYHVVFFDPKKKQRAWIRTRDLKAYQKNLRETVVKKDYNGFLDDACALANEASFMTISGRLKIFGWKGQRPKRGPPSSTRSGDCTDQRMKRRAEPKYCDGDIVWAHLKGYPWWPAIVDKCPIVRNYYQIPERSDDPIMFYVVYINENVQQVDWLPQTELQLFAHASYTQLVKRTRYGEIDYKVDLEKALALAEEAKRLSVSARLERFGVNAGQVSMAARNGLQSLSVSRDASSTLLEEENLWSDFLSSDEESSPSDESGSFFDFDPKDDEADTGFNILNWKWKNKVGDETKDGEECRRMDWRSPEIDGISIVFSEPMSSTSCESPVNIVKKSTTLNNKKSENLLKQGLFFRNPSTVRTVSERTPEIRRYQK